MYMFKSEDNGCFLAVAACDYTSGDPTWRPVLLKNPKLKDSLDSSVPVCVYSKEEADKVIDFCKDFGIKVKAYETTYEQASAKEGEPTFYIILDDFNKVFVTTKMYVSSLNWLCIDMKDAMFVDFDKSSGTMIVFCDRGCVSAAAFHINDHPDHCYLEVGYDKSLLKAQVVPLYLKA